MIIGLLLIALGVIAIALPIATSIAVGLVIGCTLLAGGVAHMVAAARGIGPHDIMMKAVAGTAYLVIGLAVLSHPLWGAATVALVVSAALIIEGLATVVAYIMTEEHTGISAWVLAGGVAAVLLGFAVWGFGAIWPVSFVAAIVGINFFAAGTSRIMASIADRRLHAAIHSW